MTSPKSTLRYLYWLSVEFIKKNLRIITISFLITFVGFISFISFSPYLVSVFFAKKEIIGIVGKYDFNNLPEEVVSKFANGLVDVSQTGEILPVLASSWEIKDQGSRYVFHLRDSLIWSNGKKFSAYDINYQFKDVEIEVIDDKTIYFKLKKPLPIFPTYLKKPILKYPLLGIAGLYKVDQFKTRYGYIIELSLSPNKKDLPFLKYKFYDNELMLINAYKRGEITQMTTSKKNIADVFQTWKNTTVSKSIDYSRLLTLFFNLKSDVLREKDLRQALIMAINPAKFKDFGEIAVGPISPISWAFTNLYKRQPFDQKMAEKIIKKTFTSSSSAQLNLSTYYDYLTYADEIINSLKSVGLNINLNLISLDKPTDFDLILAFWNLPDDPDQYFYWHSTQAQGNLGSYKNVRIDKLLEDGRSTSLLSERKKIYAEFQKIILDDPPADFLFFPYIYTIKRR